MLAAARKVFTVYEITKDLKGLIEDNFGSLWLKGEISNCKLYASGHYYFTIKDEACQISAVMFKGNALRLKFKPEDGMAIVVHGRISVYEPRGQYQIIVDAMQPDGIGELQLAFDQLKERLKKEGLFDTDRKRDLPLLPKRLGIVTSLHGAVFHDILNVTKRRFGSMDILIYPVKVQGDGAKEEIAAAINYFSREKNVDVLIVGRGGGSLEDLWAFNEEIVARAVFDSSIPVVSAVGHETDFSICDFVADVRAPTPSAAAELCVPLKRELAAHIKNTRERLIKNIEHKIINHRRDIKSLVTTLPSPELILDRIRLRVSDFSNRLVMHMRTYFDETGYKRRVREANLTLKNKVSQILVAQKYRAREMRLKLEMLNPSAILQRGYVITKQRDGSIITGQKDLVVGNTIELVYHDGTALTKVEKIL